MAEYLYYTLTFDHFLDIAVHFTDLILLTDKVDVYKRQALIPVYASAPVYVPGTGRRDCCFPARLHLF